MSFTRRDFLRASLVGGGSAALLGTLSRLGARAAFASSGSTPYKALVCVFLYGGNDSNNMLIPSDTAGYANYSSVRNSGSCDFFIKQANLLNITPSHVGGQPNTRTYGLHPSMPNTQGLFSSNNLAFLCDVGTLVGPATVPFTGTAPTNLFSHHDQQHEWQGQMANPSGVPTTGWGGALGAVLPQSSTFPAVMSTDEAALFAAGPNLPFVTQGTSVAQLGGTSDNQKYYKEVAALGDAGAVGPLLNTANALSTLSTTAGPNLATITVDPPQGWGSNVNWAPSGDAKTGTGSIIDQLHMVAQTIWGSANPPDGGVSLGLSRQVFFCGFGSFDTHTGQQADQASLLTELDDALYAFYNAMENIGMGSAVTTFTMSDFSRTFLPAALDGTDHAWGSHQIIMGGGVKGGQLYGLDPNTLLSTYAQAGSGGNIYDIGAVNGGPSEGRWIPQVSVDQYAATLANWLTKDLSNGGITLLESILPNLDLYGGETMGWPQILDFI
jgi:uncharacterized protein (DUF1501 family)